MPVKTFKLDLRQRIALVLATVCIAVVGALGGSFYFAFADMEDSLVEQIVAEEMEHLIQRERTAGSVPAGGPNLQYYVVKNDADFEKLPARLRPLAPGQHTVGTGHQEKHVGVRDVEGARYIVAYDSGQHEALQVRFRNVLMFALGTVALLAVLLGYWLATMLTRQLEDLAERVKKLAPDEPHAPLEHPQHEREVATLAHALDQYHGRIVDMVRREQEFTANASHELRTPLTAIRTSCELLAAEPELTGKARERLDMIDGAVRQMTERIETLLVLARAHGAEAAERVSLRRCVEDVAAGFSDELGRKGLAFDVAVPEDVTVDIDRKALELVLGNLIKNAITHTESGAVRVSYSGSRLTVSDSGTGISAQHLPQVFERYYRGDDKPEGLGLGLAIVRRICDDLGWKIEVESQPGSGATFSLRFA